MVTFKYKIQNKIDISNHIKQYNNVYRFAYNRFKDNPEISNLELYHLIKYTMNNIDLIDTELINSALTKASGLKDKSKVIFGGAKNFEDLKFKKITKDEFKKDIPIMLRGNKTKPYGNPKAELHIIDDNSILVKLNRKTHINIQLPKLNKKQKYFLFQLQRMCENNKTYFTLDINNEYVCISFDETLLAIGTQENNIKDRVLAFDMNPNYIGLSVIDWIDKDSKSIIYKEIIDLSKINSLNQSLYQTQKRKYETFEISKHIISLAKHYKVNIVAFEKLEIKPKDNKQGKKFNRLVNNSWLRTPFISNIKKRCNLESIKFLEMQTQYSSFIGQMTNSEEIDSIAASIEISRRANLFNKIYKEKTLEIQPIIFPEFNIDQLATRWKEMLRDNLNDIKSWLDLYNVFKKSKTCYRFLFPKDKFVGNSFSFNSSNSMVFIHKFG